MKSPKIFLKKVLIGILAIFIAAITSMAIKDVVDSYNPETSLPTLTISSTYVPPIVNSGGTQLLQSSLVRANYSWKFITGVKRGQGLSVTDCALKTETFLPEAPIIIDFSIPVQAIKVSRANGMYGSDFVEIKAPDDIYYAPAQAGDYCYLIEATFSRGEISYYLSVNVSEKLA